MDILYGDNQTGLPKNRVEFKSKKQNENKNELQHGLENGAK
jgi:hypothetical protein